MTKVIAGGVSTVDYPLLMAGLMFQTLTDPRATKEIADSNKNLSEEIFGCNLERTEHILKLH